MNESARSRLAHELRFASTQLGVWALLYGGYLFLRSLAVPRFGLALTHAAQLVRLERAAHLFEEPRLQHAIVSVGAAREFFDLYYMLGFSPLLTGTLLWLGLRHRNAYRELRTAMLASLALASLPFALYPTAPPRLVHGLGIIDTVGLSGHHRGSYAGIHFDPYAAMPSIHIGWSLLLAVVAIRVVRQRPLRLLLALHPLLMTLTVTATGNHFFIDAAAGALVALAGYALTSCRSFRLLLRPRAAGPARHLSPRCPVTQAT